MSENNVIIQFTPTLYICNTDIKERFKIVTDFNDIIVKSYSAGSMILKTLDSIFSLSEFNFLFIYGENNFNVDICLSDGQFTTINNTSILTINNKLLNQYALIKTNSDINNKVNYLSAII